MTNKAFNRPGSAGPSSRPERVDRMRRELVYWAQHEYRCGAIMVGDAAELAAQGIGPALAQTCAALVAQRPVHPDLIADAYAEMGQALSYPVRSPGVPGTDRDFHTQNGECGTPIVGHDHPPEPTMPAP